MHRNSIIRLLAMVLCMMVFMSCCVAPAANAATIRKRSATFSGVIMNNNWLFRSSSTLKIKNDQSVGDFLVTVTCSGCTVEKADKAVKQATYTIPMGGTYTLKFITPARSYGTVTIKIENTWGESNITYQMTSSNINTLVRTN